VIFSGIGFNLADKMEFVSSKKPLDVVYTIDENDWNGEKSLQLRVIDVKLTE
jgi:single-stranded-DNA-specific exonuclease